MLFTAYSMGVDKNTDAEFAYGTGHINPTRAINPGLVYDVGEIDYVNFLCGQGYSNQSLRLVTGDNSSCSQAIKKPASYLNYPCFTLSSTSKYVISRFFLRTDKCWVTSFHIQSHCVCTNRTTNWSNTKCPFIWVSWAKEILLCKRYSKDGS